MRKSLWHNLLTVSGLSVSGHNNWQAFLGDISIICLSKWLVIFLTKLIPKAREKEANLKPSLHGGNLPQVTLSNIGRGQESQRRTKQANKTSEVPKSMSQDVPLILFIYTSLFSKKCVRASLDYSYVKSLRAPFWIHLHELYKVILTSCLSCQV